MQNIRCTFQWKRWVVVAAFAAAFAWVETACVVYLRTLVDRVEPYQPVPLPASFDLTWIELVREASTLVILFAIGWLAGQSLRSRFAYILIAFGVWDILYYAFLNLAIDWPGSLWDWDILFLLPYPWWGPVLAPMLIALFMVIGGTLATQHHEQRQAPWPGPRAWLMCGVGVATALGIFMADAIKAAPLGVDAVRSTLPTSFNWPMFILALLLMAAPIVDMSIQIRDSRTDILPGVHMP